jgi:hypothetical protein
LPTSRLLLAAQSDHPCQLPGKLCEDFWRTRADAAHPIIDHIETFCNH